MLQRIRGVIQPKNQNRPANEGPANTVVAAAKVDFYIVEYFDGEGRRTKDLLLKLGEDYYVPSDGSSQVWTESLTSVRPWLREGITSKLPIKGPVKVPDNVEII